MVAHDRRFKAFVTYLPLAFPTNWWDVFRFEVAWRFSKTARCRLMQEVDKGIDAKKRQHWLQETKTTKCRFSYADHFRTL